MAKSNSCIASTQNPKLDVFKIAFDKTARARAALAADDLEVINLDIPPTISIVIGALPQIATVREEAATIPQVEIDEIDSLETYARALSFANASYLAASEPTEPLPDMLARAAQVREILLTYAKALSLRGDVDGRVLDDLKGGTGYLNVSTDLGVLVRLFRENWTAIASKAGVTAADLDDAQTLSVTVSEAFATRNGTSEKATKATDDRQRAFTLLLRAYDQAQRAVTFLRWNEDDADTFAPSLWAGRGKHSAPSPSPPPVPPATNGNGNGDTNGNNSGGNGNGTVAPTPAPPAVDPAGNPLSTTTLVAPGHRGGSPVGH